MLLPLLQNNLLQGGSDVEVGASRASLSLTTYAATISYDINVAASAESLALSTAAATVALDVAVSASSAALTLATYDATISYDVNVSAGVKALSLTTYAATVDAGEVSVNVGTAALALTTYPATVEGTSAVVAASTGAGRSSRRPPTIYRVKVDGQPFEFRSLADAIAFLNQARDAAEQLAKTIVASSAQKQRLSSRKLPRPNVARPKIEVSSRDLRGAVNETKKEIDAIYERAVLDAEIAMLIEFAARERENEEIIWFM